MSAGVYKIPNITYELLAKIIEELGGVMRKVSITIKNKTPLILENPEIYFRFGNSPYSNLDITPVKNGEGMVWGGCKTEYSLRGTEGVIVYHIKDQNKTLAFMWKVPYARESRWCVKVYDGYINDPSAELFLEMRENSHLGGDGKIHEGKLDGGLYYRGSMGGTGAPYVVVELQYCDSKEE